MLHVCSIVDFLMYIFIIHGGTEVRDYMGKNLQDGNDVCEIYFQ